MRCSNIQESGSCVLVRIVLSGSIIWVKHTNGEACRSQRGELNRRFHPEDFHLEETGTTLVADEVRKCQSVGRANGPMVFGTGHDVNGFCADPRP